ncbi:hypothetical protein K435DRAFT_966579 [Dendrothele bispora CBS 962.96]|uniref:Uncharacterized protein n=1 Tax=Dendrothele bispora (strain CBS 962.96) TaxID=1314807 RepID=A0A4S8M0K9_DENBC|nr:hypothetical protein K435DRAFT_966579 [Dendrothele bispora CBS 962.96]
MDIITSAKSGSYWTDNELEAFKIEVEIVDVAHFFCVTDLPEIDLPELRELLVETPLVDQQSDDQFHFFRYLKDAHTGEESMVDDFAAFILRLLSFDKPRRVIHTRKELSFVMFGDAVDAKTDVCVVSDLDLLLLVQEDKRVDNFVNGVPQLVAEAIAAFSRNNLMRDNAGTARLKKKVFPGILMAGTAPTFFLIPVTEELVSCIAKGIQPAHTTTVKRCIPPVPNVVDYRKDGMVPLENRKIVLQCFEALKAFVVD